MSKPAREDVAFISPLWVGGCRRLWLVPSVEWSEDDCPYKSGSARRRLPDLQRNGTPGHPELVEGVTEARGMEP